MMKKVLVPLALTVVALMSMALYSPLEKPNAFVQTVTTTATKVAPTSAPHVSFKSCRVSNLSVTPVYLGGSAVDTTDGYPLCTDSASCPESSLTVDGNGLFLVLAASTQDVNVFCGQ